MKKFLKPNGIYLCNDSHADATITYFDNDFELLGIVNYNDLIFNDDNNEKYFKLLRNRKLDLEIIKQKMKPPKYNADNYVFIKLC